MVSTVAGTPRDPIKAGTTNAPGDAKQRVPPVGPKRNSATPLSLVPHRLTAAERHRRISDLAYQRAACRGFAAGGEIEDWLEAEREVDAGRM